MRSNGYLANIERAFLSNVGPIAIEAAALAEAARRSRTKQPALETRRGRPAAPRPSVSQPIVAEAPPDLAMAVRQEQPMAASDAVNRESPVNSTELPLLTHSEDDPHGGGSDDGRGETAKVPGSGAGRAGGGCERRRENPEPPVHLTELPLATHSNDVSSVATTIRRDVAKSTVPRAKKSGTEGAGLATACRLAVT